LNAGYGPWVAGCGSAFTARSRTVFRVVTQQGLDRTKLSWHHGAARVPWERGDFLVSTRR
jgi:hypothetical protein